MTEGIAFTVTAKHGDHVDESSASPLADLPVKGSRFTTSGGQEMHGEAVVAHIGAPDQPGRHHPPTDKTLQAEQSKQDQESWLEGGRNGLLPPERRQRQREGQSDQAPQQAMQPFPKLLIP